MKKSDFEIFKETFKMWQQRFGLNGYKVYFIYEPLENSFANITVAQNDMVVTARLNSELPDKDKAHVDIEESAKHEALHLLTFRLEVKATDRYAREEEIYEASEELVRRLEGLIK